jgi:hypothetical protein
MSSVAAGSTFHEARDGAPSRVRFVPRKELMAPTSSPATAAHRVVPAVVMAVIVIVVVMVMVAVMIVVAVVMVMVGLPDVVVPAFTA